MLDPVDWDCEADADVAVNRTLDRVVDTDHLALGIHEWPTGVAWIDRGVRLAEPAGAAALAAALRLKEQLKGKRVALILSGSNITPAQLRELLAG